VPYLFTWYNEVHYHWRIGYLRPPDIHAGHHEMGVEHRQATLDATAPAYPERFTKQPAPCAVPVKAWINRPSIQNTKIFGNYLLTGYALSVTIRM
jgi:hypothetical protein